MKIIIADDHAMTRVGVSSAIAEMFPAAKIIECIDAASVLIAAKTGSVSLAIVDLFMPGSDGFVFLKKLCKSHPELPVMVLSASDNINHIRKSIDVGVSGYIHKSSGFESIRAAIETVLSGGVYLPDIAAQTEVNSTHPLTDTFAPQDKDALLNVLTKRQREVLTCLAKGMSNKQIADSLCISENTVKTHLKVIMAELDCRNRTEAGVLAEKLGLLIV
jgi:DNA-binding NarL/FixJ family response regulator